MGLAPGTADDGFRCAQPSYGLTTCRPPSAVIQGRGRAKLRPEETIMAKKPAKAPRTKTVAEKGGYTDILYDVKDQVAWVTINRPRVLNAFREQTLDELIDALKATRHDPSIACAVVTGAGDKAFSAGG